MNELHLRAGDCGHMVVQQIQVSGISGQVCGRQIYVDRTELFWRWPAGTDDIEIMVAAFKIGQTLAVRILHEAANGQLFGSVRRANDSLNPYLQLAKNSVGTTVTGKVSRPFLPFGSGTVLVTLGEADAEFPAHIVQSNKMLQELRAGDEVTAVIKSVDVDKCLVWLQPE